MSKDRESEGDSVMQFVEVYLKESKLMESILVECLNNRAKSGGDSVKNSFD